MDGKLEHLIPAMDDSKEVVRVIRELQPAHCILKVESSSLLRDALTRATKKYFLSTEFTSGGYKWVMQVYPNGNGKEGGIGHVSVHVSVVDKLDKGTFVTAVLRLFIYDQIRDNYLAVQCIRDRRFHATKTSQGISKFLPVASLDDAANGFRVNDCCVFGAEVFVFDSGHVQTPGLSMIYQNRRYTWRIKEFSKRSSDDEIYSPVFTFGVWSWKLKLCPKGYGLEKGSSMSVFLELENDDDLTKGSTLFVKDTISLKYPANACHDVVNADVCWFSSEDPSWGCEAFLRLTDQTSVNRCYLANDVLTFELCIDTMFLLKDSEK